ERGYTVRSPVRTTIRTGMRNTRCSTASCRRSSGQPDRTLISAADISAVWPAVRRWDRNGEANLPLPVAKLTPSPLPALWAPEASHSVGPAATAPPAQLWVPHSDDDAARLRPQAAAPRVPGSRRALSHLAVRGV